MKIRKAEAHEVKHYNGLHRLFGYIKVPAIVGGVKTHFQVPVEYLGEGKDEPNYEAVAPKGMHFDEEGLHSLLGTTQRDLLDRLAGNVLIECTDHCSKPHLL